MSHNTERPKWRLLNLIILLAVALLVVDSRAHLSQLGHELAEGAIVLATFGLLGLWLSANAEAIRQEPWDRRW